jgi:hypothetical protein
MASRLNISRETMLEKFFQWLQRLSNTCLTLLKVLIRSNLQPAFRSIEKLKSKSQLVILGNGPSLKSFLEKDLTFLKSKEVMCVNYFARTKEYSEVKPDHYVIVSPQYWHNKDNPDWKTEREAIFLEIAKRTHWKMTLHVPSIALDHQLWREDLEANPNIKINYFNTTPIEGFSRVNDVFYSLGLGMPRPHNVLVGGLFLGIMMGYKDIFIHGADHSWLNEIYVAPDNMVYLSQKHFYDTQVDADDHYAGPKKRPMYSTNEKKVRKLHEVLEKFTVTFQSYWELKRYAIQKRVSVYNLTPESFIDAFERKNLNEL